MISNAEEVAKKNTRKLYPCFSPNLRKFLEEHGIAPVKTAIHENSKTIWFFVVTDEVSALLTEWTKNKPTNKAVV
jgi:hypothetical protein